MVIHFCAACDWSISEQELLAGDAVKLDRDHVFCARCVQSGVLRLPRMKTDGAPAASTVIAPPEPFAQSAVPMDYPDVPYANDSGGVPGLITGPRPGSKSGIQKAPRGSGKSGIHVSPRSGKTGVHAAVGSRSGSHRAVKRGRTSVMLRAVSNNDRLPDIEPLVVRSGPRLMAVNAPVARVRPAEIPARSKGKAGQNDMLIIGGGTLLAVVLVAMVVIIGGKGPTIPPPESAQPSAATQRPTGARPLSDRAPAGQPYYRPGGTVPDPVPGQPYAQPSRNTAPATDEPPPQAGVITGLPSR